MEESSYAHEDMIYRTRREGDWNTWVDTFEYRGSMISGKSGWEEEIIHQVGAGWRNDEKRQGYYLTRGCTSGSKWQYNKMIKYIQPESDMCVQMYGSDTWAQRKAERDLLGRTEMIMYGSDT